MILSAVLSSWTEGKPQLSAASLSAICNKGVKHMRGERSSQITIVEFEYTNLFNSSPRIKKKDISVFLSQFFWLILQG